MTSRRLSSITVPPLVHAAALTLVAMLLSVVANATPVAAAPATPVFGPAIDAYSGIDSPTTCSPTAKPGPVAFRDLILTTYPSTHDSGIVAPCGGGQMSPDDHEEGRAWDWGVSAQTQPAIANDLLGWLLATDIHGNTHALLRRFGIKYVIWNRQIFKSWQAGSGWQPYSCDPNASHDDCHVRHVHFSFSWDGAYQRTTWWTAKAATRPATVQYGDSFQIFFRGADGRLKQSHYLPGNGWSFNTDLGGSIVGTAAVVVYQHYLNIFARSSTNTMLYWQHSPTAGWTNFARGLPGTLTSDPAAVVFGDSLQVFARGGDAAMRQWMYVPGSGWGYDIRVGGSITGTPAAVQYTTGLELVARGSDGNLRYWRAVTGQGWTHLNVNVGGDLGSDPAAVVFGDSVQFFARGSDGAMRQWMYVPGSGWGYNIRVGGSIAGTPAAIQRNGALELVARGSDGNLRYWRAATAQGWTHLNINFGGDLASDPAAATYGTSLQFIARATDATLRQWHHTTTWAYNISLGHAA